MLRLFGAQSTAVGKTVENFPPQWRAAAQWKSRGAETLLAVHADTPSGLKKAAQSLRSSFGADVYGAGDTSLAAAAVQALEAHDRLLACGPLVRDWVGQGASLYVCGSLEGMGAGVEQALLSILGPDLLQSLREDGRYRRDVY